MNHVGELIEYIKSGHTDGFGAEAAKNQLKDTVLEILPVIGFEGTVKQVLSENKYANLESPTARSHIAQEIKDRLEPDDEG